MAKIADMLKSGTTPEQVAAKIKAEGTGAEPEQKSASEIAQSMEEQDISIQPSLVSDLQSDYMSGAISDAQYQKIYDALTG